MEGKNILPAMTISSGCVAAQQQTSPDRDPEKLKEACSELESLFIYYLLREMRASVPKSGLMGDGKTEETYTSMMDLELSREIAQTKGIGIASAIYEKLYCHVASCEKEALNHKKDPNDLISVLKVGGSKNEDY